MGLFDTIKENTNLVRGGSSQPAGKFDQQIEAVEGKIRETLIQIGMDIFGIYRCQKNLHFP